MKTVMCFGCFDVVHPGHLYYLTESKKHGDRLIVVVARDSNILKIKGKEPKYSEKQRLEHIKTLNFVDRAVLGSENNLIKVIEENKPDTICLGYDQDTIGFEQLKDELKKRNIKADVMRIAAFKEQVFKSSKLKQD